jgi:hypothetical protein
MRIGLTLVGCLLAAFSASAQITVDHTCTDITAIPQEWIVQAKGGLHIAYGHTSHGSQLITGMTGLVAFMNGKEGYPDNLYAFNGTGAGGALDVRNAPFGPNSSVDLGYPSRTAWEGYTRTYLDANSDINVVIWSWCGQASIATEVDINTYLGLMNGLETAYSDVQFVYMTGHLDGTGLTGNLHVRNQQIRDYCQANGKILYDFEDIESYDPDGDYFGDRHATDACNYDANGDDTTDQTEDIPPLPANGDANWAIEWQNTHTPGIDWFNCSPAHTQPLNANLKAYAAWWLWARLAGWAGNDIVHCTRIALSTFNPTRGGTVSFAVGFDVSVENFDSENDVMVTETGTVSHTDIEILGGPQDYTVNVIGVSGQGSIRIAVSTASDIHDDLGNALSSSVASSEVTVDPDAPPMPAPGWPMALLLLGLGILLLAHRPLAAVRS